MRLAYDPSDHALISSSLRSVAPESVLRPASTLQSVWHATGPRPEGVEAEAVVAGFEFALGREFLFSLASRDTRALGGLLAALDELHHDESAIWQVLCQPVSQNWEALLPYAAVGPTGHPILSDRDRIVESAAEKVESGLFAVVVRLVIRARTHERSFELAAAVSGALRQLSGANALVPLSDTDPDVLLGDVLARRSRRLGMILSGAELSGLVTLPERAASATGLKLWSNEPDLPRAPEGVLLGEVAGERGAVQLSIQSRLRHVHVIGATGSGKSNLLLSLITQDLQAGRGVCLIDPHGDLAEAVLAQVPSAREREVVVLDPSDSEAVVGWNVIEAESEAEREILASDMVSVFRRLSTSWGDQMTTVLANAVLALLNSPEPATLLELRRFLHDERFRTSFLNSVADPFLVSFWRKEWPELARRKPHVPILTRLDSLSRHRRVRDVLCVRERALDFRALMDRSGILIARLPQGQLGQANTALLGSLLVSRLHQAALSRADQPEAERDPFFVYIDEFHEVATPSMRILFSGARKYGVGLCVAHHDLYQLKRAGEGLERSVMTNTYTRVAFRVDEEDARRLESGFAHHVASDLTRLPVGTAIARLGRADLDFQVAVPLVESGDREEVTARVSRIRAKSRARYGHPREEAPSVPLSTVLAGKPEVNRDQHTETEVVVPAARETAPSIQDPPEVSPPASQEYPEGRGGPEHRYLQSLIHASAQERGYRAELEVELPDGGRVDLVITPEAVESGEVEQIAVEISVTTGLEHELQNARKCLEAGYHHVALVSPRAGFRATLTRVLAGFSEADRERVDVYAPEELLSWLAALPRSQTRIAGYLVNTQVSATGVESSDDRRARLNQVIAGSLARVKWGEGR